MFFNYYVYSPSAALNKNWSLSLKKLSQIIDANSKFIDFAKTEYIQSTRYISEVRPMRLKCVLSLLKLCLSRSLYVEK